MRSKQKFVNASNQNQAPCTTRVHKRAAHRLARPLIRQSAAVALLVGATTIAHAQVTLVDRDGWKAQMMGLISGWTGNENFNDASGRPGENTARVITGFNPSKIEFAVAAPEYNGINVSSYFQLATSINGGKNVRTGEQIEVRGADISVGTPYGTFSVGRNFALFGAMSVVNDTGSMRGVGYLCTGPDGNGPNCGHIGTGYTWTDWQAGIRYTSPRIYGFQARVGAFDPVETAFGVPGGAAPFVAVQDLFNKFSGTFTNFTSIGTAIKTPSPMFQGELTWASGQVPLGADLSGNAFVWGSALNQRIEDISSKTKSAHTNIKGYNAGGRFTAKAPIGVFGLTANYEKTDGIAEGFIGFGARCNNLGCDATEGKQWYVNLDYNYGGKTTVGTSYGRGWERPNVVVGNTAVNRKLWMAYVQQQLTPNLNANLELQHFNRKTQLGGAPAGIFPAQERYTAALVGLEFRF